MKKFLIYALILGSFGYAVAEGTGATITNRQAVIAAAIHQN